MADNYWWVLVGVLEFLVLLSEGGAENNNDGWWDLHLSVGRLFDFVHVSSHSKAGWGTHPPGKVDSTYN